MAKRINQEMRTRALRSVHKAVTEKYDAEGTGVELADLEQQLTADLLSWVGRQVTPLEREVLQKFDCTVDLQHIYLQKQTEDRVLCSSFLQNHGLTFNPTEAVIVPYSRKYKWREKLVEAHNDAFSRWYRLRELRDCEIDAIVRAHKQVFARYTTMGRLEKEHPALKKYFVGQEKPPVEGADIIVEDWAKE